MRLFFNKLQKKFDIIYIDACGSIPSSQHALRCISTICQYHRLNSPGVIVSNFAEPNNDVESIKEFCELISQYLFFKKYPALEVSFDENGISNSEYFGYKEKVKENLRYYYGEFISAVLRDIPSLIIPLQRLATNPYVIQIFDIDAIKNIGIEDLIKMSKDYSLASFFSVEMLSKIGSIGEKSQCFLKEIGSYNNLIAGLKWAILLREKKIELHGDIQHIRNYFEDSNKLYQFLDKPHSNILFDVITNQLTYPMHYNVTQNKRYQYNAKRTNMFTDVNIYDECRYIYEWIPALH